MVSPKVFTIVTSLFVLAAFSRPGRVPAVGAGNLWGEFGHNFGMPAGMLDLEGSASIIGRGGYTIDKLLGLNALTKRLVLEQNGPSMRQACYAYVDVHAKLRKKKDADLIVSMHIRPNHISGHNSAPI